MSIWPSLGVFLVKYMLLVNQPESAYQSSNALPPGCCCATQSIGIRLLSLVVPDQTLLSVGLRRIARTQTRAGCRRERQPAGSRQHRGGPGSARLPPLHSGRPVAEGPWGSDQGSPEGPGCGEDQLCSPGSQRTQLPRLPQVCQALCAGAWPERVHPERHHRHQVHHRVGRVHWRRPVAHHDRAPTSTHSHPGEPQCASMFEPCAGASAG